MRHLRAHFAVLLSLVVVISIGYLFFIRDVKNSHNYTASSAPDIADCEAYTKYNDPKDIGGCYARHAGITGDLRYCHKKAIDVAYCYTDVAVHDKSLTLCDEIISRTVKARCYSAVASATNDPSICYKIKGVSDYWGTDSCLKSVSLAAQDPAKCDSIVDVTTKDNCYRNLSLLLGDVSLCEKVTNKQSAALCRDKYHQDFGDQNCSVLGAGWEKFTQDSPRLSFCYKDSWGKPVVNHTNASQSQKGSVSYVTFTKSRGNYPLVTFSTTDYKRLGDSDVPQFAWSRLDFSLDNSALEKALGIAGEGWIVYRGAINSKQMIQVKWDFNDPLSGDKINAYQWYIPKALNNGQYNLDVLGSDDQSPDISRMVSSMSFK